MGKVVVNVPEGYEVQVVKCGEKKESIKTYQDLITIGKYIDKGYWIADNSKIAEVELYNINDETDKNITASEKVAKSMLAMAMISQLMPYYGGEITDEEWSNSNTQKYLIQRVGEEIRLIDFSCTYGFLAFHTEEQRDEFLKYNKQLIKDYLMINS